jgi:hypothetical protein
MVLGCIAMKRTEPATRNAQSGLYLRKNDSRGRDTPPFQLKRI